MKKQAFNPYLPSYEYIPDGEPHVFGDRVYVYGSHDRFNGEVFCQNDYVCWSAPVEDLSDWRYEGVIYRKDQDPYNTDGKRCLYAPDVAQGPDGKYYLYYALDSLGIMAVAVSDRPAGPYDFYSTVNAMDGHPIGSEAGDINQFDPGIFVDDDGRIYLYSGFAPFRGAPKDDKMTRGRKFDGAYVMELDKDMCTVINGPSLILPQESDTAGTGFEGRGFFEASSMRKIGKKYYFIYSSSMISQLNYAVSDYPDRDFHYGGAIVSNGDVGLNGRTLDQAVNYIGNNHGSIVEIQGKWYIFYHRHTNRHSFSRQACAEEIQILPDGSIPQVEITSCGLNGGPLMGSGEYSTSIACHLTAPGGMGFGQRMQNPDAYLYLTQTGGDREDAPEQYVANMQNGAVAGFKYFDLRKTEHIGVQVSGAAGRLTVTNGEGALLAEIEFQDTETPEWFEAVMNPGSEKSALYFRYEGNGTLNFWNFRLSSVQ